MWDTLSFIYFNCMYLKINLCLMLNIISGLCVKRKLYLRLYKFYFFLLYKLGGNFKFSMYIFRYIKSLSLSLIVS